MLSILSKRWLLHVVFWSLTIADAYFGNVKYMTETALRKHLLYSVSIHLVQVYFNIFFLYPKLFQRGKIWQYGASLIASVFFFAGVANWLYMGANILKDIPYRYFFFRQLYVQGLTTGAKFLRSGIFNYYKMKQMQEAQQQAEIRLLKSQVNPHFLFNTLNSLYFLTLRQSPSAPETVLRLSELMRYMTTVAGMDRVGLDKEVAYLRNYVELEKLRLDRTAYIEFHSQGDFEQRQIAPLLLLPFVENAFKHGVETQTDNVWVEINVSLQANELFLYVRNSCPPRAGAPEIPSGTGLNNARQRLQLTYPGRHELNIRPEDSFFTVKLRIEL